MKCDGRYGKLTVEWRSGDAIRSRHLAEIPSSRDEMAGKHVDEEGESKTRNCQASREEDAIAVPSSRNQSIVEDTEYQLG